jgi:hypothetical protein
MHNVQIEHENSILSIENTLIGERLKGLNDSLMRISGLYGLHTKTTQEFDKVIEAVKVLADYNSNFMKDLDSIIEDRDLNRLNANQAMLIQEIAVKDRAKIFNLYKDKTTKLKAELQQALEQVESYRQDLVDLHKTYQGVVEESYKLKKRLSAYNNSKSYSNSDKICKRCKRLYSELTNYNWSCKSHPSEYSGEIWWCCGKANKNDPGCIATKHESKSDEEDDLFMLKDKKPGMNLCSVFII